MKRQVTRLYYICRSPAKSRTRMKISMCELFKDVIQELEENSPTALDATVNSWLSHRQFMEPGASQ